jgi:hypothetical protein
MDDLGDFTFTDTTRVIDDGDTLFIPGHGYRKYVAVPPGLDYPIPPNTEFSVFTATDQWRLFGGLIDVTDGNEEVGLNAGESTGGILTAEQTPEIDDVYYDGVVLHRYRETGWDPPVNDRVVFIETLADGAEYVVEINGNAYSYVASVPPDTEYDVLVELKNAIDAGDEGVTVTVTGYDGVFGLHVAAPAYTIAVRSSGGGIRMTTMVYARHYVSYLLKAADLEHKPYGELIAAALRGDRVAQLPDISWWEDWDPEEFDFTDKAGQAFMDALGDLKLDSVFHKFRLGLTYSGYLDLRRGALSNSINLRGLLARRFGGDQTDNVPINQSTFVPNESDLEPPETPGDFDGDFDEVY